MVLETIFKRLKRKVVAGSTQPTIDLMSAKHLDACLETVVHWIEIKYGKTYFVRPLEEFAEKFGKTFSEDVFYQDRMNYFLEYCVLDRPISDSVSGQTPLSAFISNGQSQMESGVDPWSIFKEFTHSIFEVLRASEQRLTIQDLQSKKKFYIYSKNGEILKFLRPKTIFQSYIFGAGDIRYLGQGMILHPIGARKSLKKKIKSREKGGLTNGLEFLILTAKTNMRFLRMQHVDPAVIYKQYLG